MEYCSVCQGILDQTTRQCQHCHRTQPPYTTVPGPLASTSGTLPAPLMSKPASGASGASQSAAPTTGPRGRLDDFLSAPTQPAGGFLQTPPQLLTGILHAPTHPAAHQQNPPNHTEAAQGFSQRHVWPVQSALVPSGSKTTQGSTRLPRKPLHTRVTTLLLVFLVLAIIGLLLVTTLSHGDLINTPGGHPTPPRGTTITTYTGHIGHVTAISWSPDGTRIASGGQDGTIQVWAATSGKLLLTYHAQGGSVDAVAWSPDGRRIASSGQSTVQIWDVLTGTTLVRLAQADLLAWSPDGKELATGVGNQVQVWESATGKPLVRSQIAENPFFLGTDTITALAWAPDGTSIAAATGGLVDILNAATGAVRQSCNQGGISSIFSLAWSPTSQRIVYGGSQFNPQVCDVSTGKPVLTYHEHAYTILIVAWSPNGKDIASGGDDQHVELWEASTGTSTFTYQQHANWVRAVAWSPDGRRIASGDDNGVIRVWQAQ